jgi:nitroreductase
MSHPKIALADHDIHELIRHRWSPRAFDAARAVPRADWLRLFEAARWAPSSRNEQPWRFLVLDRATAAEPWRALFDTLTTKNRAWAESAPCSARCRRMEYEDRASQTAWRGMTLARLWVCPAGDGSGLVGASDGGIRPRCRAPGL